MDSSLQRAFVDQIVELIIPQAWSVEDRKGLVLDAFLTTGNWFYKEIDVDLPSHDFALHCIDVLTRRGCYLLLETLLVKLQSRYGTQAHIERLLLALPAYCAAQQAPADPVLQPLDASPSAPHRPTLFISCAAEETERARRLAAELARYGHACQLERHPEKGSDAWLAATAAGLSNAYAVVLLAGAETWQDRWVQVELLAALDKRKRIVPVLLPDGRLPAFLPSKLPQIDLNAAGENSLQALLRYLPAPPSIVAQTAWASLSPALLQRADELIYMDRLKMAELRHVAQYTQLSGESQFRRTRGDKLLVPSVVARQELIHARWRQGMETPTEVRRFEDAVPELQAIRRAVLLGEPGAGKTTTLYKLAADLIDTALLDRSAPVPLMVRLGLWTDAAEPLADFLRRSVAELGAGLDQRLANGRGVLLLDGLNEIPAGQQAKKVAQVDRFLARVPEVMAVVSCREQDYPAERALALDRVTVAPLDPLRIYEFVHNYLDRDYGSDAGDDLFWKLAGEEARQSIRVVR